MDEDVRHGKIGKCAQLLMYLNDSQKNNREGTLNVTHINVM